MNKSQILINLIIFASFLYFLMQSGIISKEIAISFFIFILIIFAFQILTRVKIHGNTSSKEIEQTYGKPQSTKTVFLTTYKKTNSSIYITSNRKTAKLHIYTEFLVLEINNSALKLSKENVILENLPANTSFGIRVDDMEYYFRTLFDINSTLNKRI